MSEILYGRLSQLEAALGGRAAIEAAYEAKQTLVGGPNTSDTVASVEASGAAQTISDPAAAGNATISEITLTADCVLTFPAAAAGKSFALALVQDSTARAVTWPGTVKWPDSTAPTLSSASGKVDVFAFVCVDGVHWLGFVSGQNY